jgi:hypothetical protein
MAGDAMTTSRLLDAAVAFLFFCAGALLLAVACYLFVGTAHAEELAHWPPCGERGEDLRCPGALARSRWAPGRALDAHTLTLCTATECALVVVFLPDSVPGTLAPAWEQPDALHHSPRFPPELQCTP